MGAFALGEILDRKLPIARHVSGNTATCLDQGFATSCLPAIACLRGDEDLWRQMQALALPILTLTIAISGQTIRLTRAAILNILSAPFIEMAILKGVRFRLNGDRVRWFAPVGVVTEADLAELRRHKAAVQVILCEAERDEIEERAAILEFDAALPRHEAELRAREERPSTPNACGTRAVTSLEPAWLLPCLLDELEAAGVFCRTAAGVCDLPIVTVTTVRDWLELTPAGVNNFVRRLEAIGLLREIIGYARNRRFRFDPYLRLFEDGGRKAADLCDKGRVATEREFGAVIAANVTEPGNPRHLPRRLPLCPERGDGLVRGERRRRPLRVGRPRRARRPDGGAGRRPQGAPGRGRGRAPARLRRLRLTGRRADP